MAAAYSETRRKSSVMVVYRVAVGWPALQRAAGAGGTRAARGVATLSLMRRLDETVAEVAHTTAVGS